MDGPLTTIETRLTMRRSDFAFLHAAFANVGWEVTEDVEGVTTDDGYDHELSAAVRIRVPLEVLVDAPDHKEIMGDALERLLNDHRVVA